MARRKISAAAATEKFKRNTQGAQQSYKDGVSAVTENPAEAAKAAIPRMRAGFNQAIDDGTVAAGLDTVTLPGWKAAASGAAPKYTEGCQKGAAKMGDYLAEAMPVMESITASLPPRGDLEANLQRSAQMAREAAKRLKGLGKRKR